MKEAINALADRLADVQPYCTTEEATKNALIMPFIAALGYNVFDPTKVVPEYTADVGIKQGEKVDYAIIREGHPMILIECKAAIHELGENHASQLYRYFTTTKARFGILTNGIEYRIYTDLDQTNIMDKKPFLDFKISDCDEKILDELKRFTKSDFDVDEILSNASQLKYSKAIKRIFQAEWANPSDEFIKYFAYQVYTGRMTQNTLSNFHPIVKSTFQEFVNDVISKRLKIAITEEKENSEDIQLDDGHETDSAEANSDTEISEIVTTEDEIEGFYVVKAILREVCDINRVYMRDTKSYCGILFDNNNRKPICRLHFNRESKMYLGVLDEHKNETRHAISSLDDIYQHADALRKTVKTYLEPDTVLESSPT